MRLAVEDMGLRRVCGAFGTVLAGGTTLVRFDVVSGVRVRRGGEGHLFRETSLACGGGLQAETGLGGEAGAMFAGDGERTWRKALF